MSGFLSTVSNAGNLASTVVDLLFGGGGNPITLGDFVFQSFEVPETVTWGGVQKTVIHLLIGGDRVVDRLGFEPSPIRWSGIFLGPGSSDRAEQLQKLSFDGNEQRLIFASSDYQVILCRFTSETHRPEYVTYQIECDVVRDNARTVSGSGSSFLDTLNSDVSNALGFNVGATLSAGQQVIQSSIRALQPVIGSLSAIFPGSRALQGVTAGLINAQGVIAQVGGVANSAMRTLSVASNGVGNMLGQKTLAGALQAMPIIGQTSATLSGAAMSAAYVNHAQNNVTDWSAGAGTSATWAVDRFLPSN